MSCFKIYEFAIQMIVLSGGKGFAFFFFLYSCTEKETLLGLLKSSFLCEKELVTIFISGEFHYKLLLIQLNVCTLYFFLLYSCAMWRNFWRQLNCCRFFFFFLLFFFYYENDNDDGCCLLLLRMVKKIKRFLFTCIGALGNKLQ